MQRVHDVLVNKWIPYELCMRHNEILRVNDESKLKLVGAANHFASCSRPPTMRFQLGSSVHGQIQLARPSRILALMVSYLAQSAYAQGPVQIPWADCFTGANVNQRLNVTSVYAQLFGEKSLNVTILGESSGPIRGQVNDSSNLGMLFVSRYVMEAKPSI